MTTRRNSTDIPRSELISMISILRGELYDYRYLLLDRPAGHSDTALLEILDNTSFDIDDVDMPDASQQARIRGTFKPSGMKEETPFGCLTLEEEKQNRFRVVLTAQGQPQEELHCGADPYCAYTYFCGFVTAAYKIGEQL